MKIRSIFTCFVVSAISILHGQESKVQDTWMKVLSFNAAESKLVHKADIGNHKYISAAMSGDNLGWYIEVKYYGGKGENLLCNGENWHGVQPWMVYAWKQANQEFPDLEEISYENGKSKIKIVLVNCSVIKNEQNTFEFKTGKIEVFQKQF